MCIPYEEVSLLIGWQSSKFQLSNTRAIEENQDYGAHNEIEQIENIRLPTHKIIEPVGFVEVGEEGTNLWNGLQNVSNEDSEDIEQHG